MSKFKRNDFIKFAPVSTFALSLTSSGWGNGIYKILKKQKKSPFAETKRGTYLIQDVNENSAEYDVNFIDTNFRKANKVEIILWWKSDG